MLLLSFIVFFSCGFVAIEIRPLDYRRAGSRSEKSKQASLFSRLLATFADVAYTYIRFSKCACNALFLTLLLRLSSAYARPTLRLCYRSGKNVRFCARFVVGWLSSLSLYEVRTGRVACTDLVMRVIRSLHYIRRAKRFPPGRRHPHPSWCTLLR